MKVARWLLERFEVHEALIGDIAEERRTGRSAGWLLWQCCIAIAQNVWKELRGYPWLIPQAILAYFVGWIGFLVSSMTAWNWVLFPNPSHFSTPAEASARWGLTVAVFFFASFVSGWLVARVLRRHRAVFGLAWCLLLALPFWTEALFGPAPDPRKVFAWDTPLLRASLVTLGVLLGSLLVPPAARRRSTAAPSE